MLTKIKLENFKSWRELNLDLGRITLLFGTNSSGKSSVLKALLLLKQTILNPEGGTPINLGGTERDYVDLGRFHDIVFRQNQFALVNIALQWQETDIVKEPSQPVTFNFDVQFFQIQPQVVGISYLELSSQPLGFKSILHLYDSFKDRYSLTVQTEAKTFSPISNLSPVLHPIFIDRLPELDDDGHNGDEFLSVQRTFAGTIRKRFDDTSIRYLGPLRTYPQRTYLWRGASPTHVGINGDRTIDILLAEPTLVEHISEWLVMLGLVERFNIVPVDEGKRFYEPRVQIGGDDSALIDVGFGVSQVLPVITLLFTAPKGSTILLEQPELHLHPSAQAGLADLFLHVAEKRNLQLIIESHSEHILARMQRRIAEAENPVATPEQVKAYFCQMGSDGSILEPVRLTRFGEVENWPPNFFGDVSGDVEAMSRAGLKRRREEIRKNKGASDQ